MKFARLLVVALVLVSCRSTRPVGAPVEPIVAVSADEAMRQLHARRASFTGMRSLSRIRATVNGKTQSFRAQLAVHDAQRMELTAYTPVGTTAMTMKADGNRITTDPPAAPESFAFLRDAGLTPAETAMLLLGLPPRDDLEIEYAPGGIASARAGKMTVQFDPPSFPASHVVITSGGDRIEITHDEVVREN